MEQWQIDAIQAILEIPVSEVEEGSRVYLSSATYGNSRYHMIDKKYDSIQVEQVDIEEKWGKRVNIYTDEIPQLLKTLLVWHLSGVKSLQESTAKIGEDALGDLDDHPF